MGFTIKWQDRGVEGIAPPPPSDIYQDLFITRKLVSLQKYIFLKDQSSNQKLIYFRNKN